MFNGRRSFTHLPRSPSNTPNSPPHRKVLQILLAPIEKVGISPKLIRIRILPNRLCRPPPWNNPNRTRPSRQHQRVRILKHLRIPRALSPPRRICINHRIPRRYFLVPLTKLSPSSLSVHTCLVRGTIFVGRRTHLPNPRHHLPRPQPPARRLTRNALHVQHPRERDAIRLPPAAVRDEKVGLRRGVGDGPGEVVGAADETGSGGAGEVRGEGLVEVVRAFCCLWCIRMG